MSDSTDTRNSEAMDQEETTIKVNDRRLLSEEERTGVRAPTPNTGPGRDDSGVQAGGEESNGPASGSGGKQGEGEKNAAHGTARPEEKAQAVDPTLNEILATCISLLAAHAWQRMGLQVSPTSGRMVKDLEEARVAIDSLADLVERLHPRLSRKEGDELQGMLSTLRVNFVQQSNA